MNNIAVHFENIKWHLGPKSRVDEKSYMAPPSLKDPVHGQGWLVKAVDGNGNVLFVIGYEKAAGHYKYISAMEAHCISSMLL